MTMLRKLFSKSPSPDTEVTVQATAQPWLIALCAVSLLGVVTLGATAWRLNSELDTIKVDPLLKSSRLAALAEDEKQQSADELLAQSLSATPYPFTADPFSTDPFFADPFFTDPFAQMQQMRQQMNHLFGSAFGGPFAGSNASTFGTPFGRPGFGIQLNGSLLSSQPDIALEDKGDRFQIVIPVPENTQFDIKTELDENVLHLAATMRSRQEDNRQNLYSSAISTSQFSRSIRLPGKVDATGMSTEHNDEQIVITIPKLS